MSLGVIWDLLILLTIDPYYPFNLVSSFIIYKTNFSNFTKFLTINNKKQNINKYQLCD